MATSLNKMALGILEFKMSRKQRFYYLTTTKKIRPAERPLALPGPFTGQTTSKVSIF